MNFEGCHLCKRSNKDHGTFLSPTKFIAEYVILRGRVFHAEPDQPPQIIKEIEICKVCSTVEPQAHSLGGIPKKHQFTITELMMLVRENPPVANHTRYILSENQVVLAKRLFLERHVPKPPKAEKPVKTLKPIDPEDVLWKQLNRMENKVRPVDPNAKAPYISRGELVQHALQNNPFRQEPTLTEAREYINRTIDSLIAKGQFVPYTSDEIKSGPRPEYIKIDYVKSRSPQPDPIIQPDPISIPQQSTKPTTINILNFEDISTDEHEFAARVTFDTSIDESTALDQLSQYRRFTAIRRDQRKDYNQSYLDYIMMLDITHNEDGTVTSTKWEFRVELK